MHKNRKEVYQRLFNKLIINQNKIILKFISVQQQRGYNDCGLFALAFFISLFHNEDPHEKLYIQEEMRKHYTHCKVNENVTDFP